MDTSELTALAGSTTERLRALWAEIGEGEEEQHAQLVALKEAVTAVYDRAVASQTETKESLEKEIAANKADIVNTMQQLGCSQEDVDEVDSLADPEATLREQVASLDEAVGTWNARKEERICEISGALTELNQLRFELGEPAVDGFEAIGDDCSESYQRAAVEHVMAAQSLKKEREERRAALIQQLSELVTELCIEGEELTQYDELAVEQNAEAIGLHAATLDAMDERCEELMAIKRARQDHLKSLAEKITALWERLFVSEQERQQFFSNHSGLGTRTLEACEAELERLLVLKQASLKDLIARARARLVELWDILCVPDEERRQFVPAFTDQFTDESLTSHEKLVATLEHRVETMQPLRELVDKREDILAKKIEFDRTSQDPNRFKIPGRLVEEEKFRKVLTKVLPRIEAKLQKQIPAWEADHGPFVLHGRRYLEIIEEASQSRGTKQVTSRVMSHVKKGGNEEAAGAAAATPRPASRAGSRRNSRRDSVKRPGTATRSRTSKENAGNRGTNSKRSTPARASSAVKKNPTRSRATGIPRPTGTTGIPKPQVMTRSKSSSSATSNTSSASSASPTPSASGFVSLADMEV